MRLSPYNMDRRLAEAFATLRDNPEIAPIDLIESRIGLGTYRAAMQCPDNEELSGFAEDALSFSESIQIAHHLRSCPVCQSGAAANA